MQEAGADAVLELAYTIANGIEYCRTGIKVQQIILWEVCHRLHKLHTLHYVVFLVVFSLNV